MFTSTDSSFERDTDISSYRNLYEYLRSGISACFHWNLLLIVNNT